MTPFKPPNRRILRYLIVTLFIGVAGLLSLKVLLPGPEPHTLILTSEDMEFRSDDPEPRFPPGSRVHLIFRNQDRGIRHQLAIPALEMETPVLRSGEEIRRTLMLPGQDTILHIECPLHPMMSSRIIVGSPGTVSDFGRSTE
ncbi:MAG TPA: hypothetical protein VKA68_15735 [bacterium]|nr:hypothetical protein [bacterium]